MLSTSIGLEQGVAHMNRNVSLKCREMTGTYSQNRRLIGSSWSSFNPTLGLMYDSSLGKKKMSVGLNRLNQLTYSTYTHGRSLVKTMTATLPQLLWNNLFVELAYTTTTTSATTTRTTIATTTTKTKTGSNKNTRVREHMWVIFNSDLIGLHRFLMNLATEASRSSFWKRTSVDLFRTLPNTGL